MSHWRPAASHLSISNALILTWVGTPVDIVHIRMHTHSILCVESGFHFSSGERSAAIRWHQTWLCFCRARCTSQCNARSLKKVPHVVVVCCTSMIDVPVKCNEFPLSIYFTLRRRRTHTCQHFPIWLRCVCEWRMARIVCLHFRAECRRYCRWCVMMTTLMFAINFQTARHGQTIGTTLIVRRRGIFPIFSVDKVKRIIWRIYYAFWEWLCGQECGQNKVELNCLVASVLRRFWTW